MSVVNVLSECCGEQSVTLRRLRARGGQVWRAYSLKEAFRSIFRMGRDPVDRRGVFVDAGYLIAEGAKGFRGSER